MNYKKKAYSILLLCFSISIVSAQGEIKPEEGYSPQIGIMVDMLEELKALIEEQTRDLNLAETDFLFDEQANSIGAMIMHIAATEAYMQAENLEERQWTEEEMSFWAAAGGLGEESRTNLKGKPITYYLNLWDEVRKKTLEGLKTKDDAWFAASADEGLNNHWVWFHILKHSANHRGQIALVKARLPK